MINKKKLKKFVFEKDYKRIIGEVSISDIQEVISYLKSLDFLIDLRGENKYKEDIEYFEEMCDINQFLDYLREVKIINLFFEEVRLMQDRINLIPPKYILSFLFFYISLQDNITRNEIKNFDKYNADVEVVKDKITEKLSAVIKSLVYNTNVYIEDKFIYTPKAKHMKKFYLYKDIIDQYIISAMEASYWNEKYSFWKRGLYKIIEAKKGEFELVLIDKSIIINEQLFFIKNKIYLLMLQVKYEVRCLESKKHITYSYEYWDYVFQHIINEFLKCDLSNIINKGITIRDLLDSYLAVFEFSNKKSQFKGEFEKDVEKNIFTRNIKNKKFWEKIFLSKGINRISVNPVFECLEFKKVSPDFFDNPFIKIKNKYYIISEVLKNMNVGRVLLSRLSSKDIDVSFKGIAFEKEIIDFLEVQGIPVISLHHKINNMEYECDTVFFLNNTIVFCEVKNRYNNDNYAEINLKLIDDADQLKRISDFYIKNINLVEEGFRKKGYIIEFNNLKCRSIVIHSQPIGIVVKHNNINIVDFETFKAPFDRETYWQNFINDKRIKFVFEGRVTINKIFSFYEFPYFYFTHKKDINFYYRSEKLGKINYSISDFVISELNTEEIMLSFFEIFSSNK